MAKFNFKKLKELAVCCVFEDRYAQHCASSMKKGLIPWTRTQFCMGLPTQTDMIMKELELEFRTHK